MFDNGSFLRLVYYLSLRIGKHLGHNLQLGSLQRFGSTGYNLPLLVFSSVIKTLIQKDFFESYIHIARHT